MSHKQAKRARQAQRDEIRRLLGAVGEELQERFRARARADRDRFPDQAPPCHTCAMNPSTNEWRGADSTALRFLAALYHHEPFYCHDGAPFDEATGWAVDTETAPLCAGYATLATVNRAELRDVFRSALQRADIMEVPQEGWADDLIDRMVSMTVGFVE